MLFLDMFITFLRTEERPGELNTELILIERRLSSGLSSPKFRPRSRVSNADPRSNVGDGGVRTGAESTDEAFSDDQPLPWREGAPRTSSLTAETGSVITFGGSGFDDDVSIVVFFVGATEDAAMTVSSSSCCSRNMAWATREDNSGEPGVEGSACVSSLALSRSITT